MYPLTATSVLPNDIVTILAIKSLAVSEEATCIVPVKFCAAGAVIVKFLIVDVDEFVTLKLVFVPPNHFQYVFVVVTLGILVLIVIVPVKVTYVDVLLTVLTLTVGGA